MIKATVTYVKNQQNNILINKEIKQNNKMRGVLLVCLIAAELCIGETG